MTNSKTLENLVAENVAPFMLKDAGINATFVTPAIRKEYVEKITAELVWEGTVNNVQHKLISISTEGIIGGVLFSDDNRDNLSLHGYNETLKDIQNLQK